MFKIHYFGVTTRIFVTNFLEFLWLQLSTQCCSIVTCWWRRNHWPCPIYPTVFYWIVVAFYANQQVMFMHVVRSKRVQKANINTFVWLPSLIMLLCLVLNIISNVNEFQSQVQRKSCYDFAYSVLSLPKMQIRLPNFSKHSIIIFLNFPLVII